MYLISRLSHSSCELYLSSTKKSKSYVCLSNSRNFLGVLAKDLHTIAKIAISYLKISPYSSLETEGIDKDYFHFLNLFLSAKTEVSVVKVGVLIFNGYHKKFRV